MLSSDEVKYLQDKLGKIYNGKRVNWTLKDRALVSRLLIDLSLFPSDSIQNYEYWTGVRWQPISPYTLEMRRKT